MLKWIRKIIRTLVLVPHKDPPFDHRFDRLNQLVNEEGDMSEIEEHLVGLMVESYGHTIKTHEELRKRTIENRVLYGITIGLIIGGFFIYGNLAEQANHIDDQQNLIQLNALNLIVAQREACKRTNIVRANQADVLYDDIESSRIILKELGSLEGFRSHIEARIEQRKKQLEVLRESVQDHPNSHPYHIKCEKAYVLTTTP